jgi:hypothetical protein
LAATVDTRFVPLAKKSEEKNLFPSSPKYTIFNTENYVCVFALLTTGSGSDVRSGDVAGPGPVNMYKSMQISDVVAMSGDANTRVTTLLTFIHNDMRYNSSKEVFNDFADALMYEPCDINAEDDNLR